MGNLGNRTKPRSITGSSRSSKVWISVSLMPPSFVYKTLIAWLCHGTIIDPRGRGKLGLREPDVDPCETRSSLLI
jgi:hypothetical protein